MDWDAVRNRRARSPYVPPINDALDSSNFDEYDEDDNTQPYIGSQEFFVDF